MVTLTPEQEGYLLAELEASTSVAQLNFIIGRLPDTVGPPGPPPQAAYFAACSEFYANLSMAQLAQEKQDLIQDFLAQ